MVNILQNFQSRTCLNTKFPKREGKYGAIPTHITIKHCLVIKIIKLINCELYSLFEKVSSYHRIVSAKKRLILRRNKKQTVKTTSYDLSSFTNRDINNKYTVSMRNKFDTLHETSETRTPNDEYENFVTAQMGVTTVECIPIILRVKCRVPWESQEVSNKRDNLKNPPYSKKEPNKCQRAET